MKQRLTRYAKNLLALAFGLALSVLLLESALFLFYSARDGEMVSAAERFRRDQDTFVAEQTGTGQDCSYLESFYPHPYLGFVHHANPPCGLPRARTNNVGLYGRNFPWKKPADRFVILVSGGSVAAQFSSLVRSQPSDLERLLNQRYLPPSGSSFLVLNGGEGGWSHPQQAILFLLYSDLVDAVVTLDGFNEIQIMNRGFRLEYPGVLFHKVNPVASEGYRNLLLTFVGKNAAGLVRNNPVLSRSYTGYFAVGRIREAIDREIERSGGQRPETSVESIFSFPEELSPEQRFDFNVDQYRRYIRSMRHLSSGFGIRTAHFLQPVPAIGKKLTDVELSVAGDLGYGEDYQRLVDGLLELGEEGVPVVSLLDVFDGEAGDIYADTIHCIRERKGEGRVVSTGYRLMARAMADALARIWGLERK